MRQLHWLEPMVQQSLSLFSVPTETKKSFQGMPTWMVSTHVADSFMKAVQSNPILQKAFGGGNLWGGAHAIGILTAFGHQPNLYIYKIANEFGSVLMKADCKVSVKYITFDNIIRCIEFPDGIAFDMGDGDLSPSCYVAAFKPDVEYSDIKGNRYDRMIDITAPLYKNGIPYAQDNLRVLLADHDTIEMAIDRAIEKTSEANPTGFTRPMVEYILKCLLYIHSGDPDLREYKPLPKPKNAKAIKRWRKENLCPVPVTLVGFDYHKPKQYSAEEAFVNTHLRWQPYGPERSQVKLIWVKEHVRRFKKENILSIEK